MYELYEFKASLVYQVSPRKSKATWRDPISKRILIKLGTSELGLLVVGPLNRDKTEEVHVPKLLQGGLGVGKQLPR